MPSNPPRVFVTGCPRSGTSLMKVLLYSLKGLHGDYEEQGPVEGTDHGLVCKRPYRPANAGDINEALRLGYKVIIMVRDGRDVMTSRAPLKPGEYYVKQPGLWAEAIENEWPWIVPLSMITKVVRYEALVASPGTVMRCIAHWLKLERVEDPRDQLKKLPPGTTLEAAMRGQQKITTAHVGQWKRDPARVAEVIADPDLRNRMCKWLIRLGYERDGQWLRSCL